MLFMEKNFGLVSETGGFLVDPGPEPSEPAVVEASHDYDKENQWLGHRNRTRSGKSWSGAFRSGRRGGVG